METKDYYKREISDDELFTKMYDYFKDNVYCYTDGWIMQELLSVLCLKYKFIIEETIGESRWAVRKSHIYEIENSVKNIFVSIRWNEPYTFLLEGQDTNPDLIRVRPKQVTITEYVAY